jgi:rubrerythrin
MEKEKNELIEILSELIQLDNDVVYAYNQVLDDIEDKIIRARLTEFRDIHRNHAEFLSEELRALIGTPPKIGKDIKGYVIEAFAAVRGFTGMKGALKALRAIEERTNRQYGEVVSKNVPHSVKEILRKHLTDERIHLDYLDSNLAALQ